MATEEVTRAFGTIARELESLDEVPEVFAELVQIAADDEAGVEELETAAELLSPTDVREAREFCVVLRDSHAGEVALTEGLDLLDRILAGTHSG